MSTDRNRDSTKPVPPTLCKRCLGAGFEWWGMSAFKCKGCGDVAHWLSPEQREALRAAAALART